MEEVRHAVKIGDYDAAYETLENVGLTAKIKAIINAIENPETGVKTTTDQVQSSRQ